MSELSTFDFVELKDLIKYQVETKLLNKSGRKTSNLSRMAKTMGYKSPSILSMLMKGQRVPSDDMVNSMIKTWKLNNSETDFLKLLVQAERDKKKGRDPSPTLEKLRKLASGKNSQVFNFSLNQFSIIREWHYLVIKQLVSTPDFKEDAKWISSRLRKKITPGQADQALKVLLEMGLLQRDPVTLKLNEAVKYTESSHDIPSEAIRMHHHGMLERASEALEEQSVLERQFNSLTFKVDPQRLPELKTKILDFLRGLNEDFDSPASEHIFQLNAQLFEHTRGDSNND